jgi:hypothetical protein
MSSKAASDRKRKPTAEVPEAVVSIDDQSKSKGNIKARRVSTDASASTNANAPVRAVATSTADTASASSDSEQGSMESIGKLIQDLFNSAKVDAALNGLVLALDLDKEKCDIFVTAGVSFALVQLVNDCLKKATKKVPAYNEVTNLNKAAELLSLYKTFFVIQLLTRAHDESKAGISSVGGVEEIVRVMKAFPYCHILQREACGALNNLIGCSIGKKKAVEIGAMEVVLAVINNNLGITARACEYACSTLSRMVADSKENTELFISSSGVATMAKVRKACPDDDEVEEAVRVLMTPVLKELSSWSQAK